MKKLRDIIPGERFGRWTVIEPSTILIGKAKTWLCRCECGTERLLPNHRLLNGTSRSCGCLRVDLLKQRRQDLTGQRFTRLTVISLNESGTWLCRCDCGKLCSLVTNHLTTGHTKSCGCYNRDHVKNDLAKYRPIAWAKRKQQFFEGTSISAIVVGKRANKTSMSGIRGVTLLPNGRFRAELTLQGKRYNLGFFSTKEEAAEARRLAEKNIFAPVIEAYEAKRMNKPEE